MSTCISRPNDAPLEALGNPVRRQIIHLLSECERTVGDLADVLPISRPAVSRHLRLLSEAGLVAHQEKGTLNIYHLKQSGFHEARSWLDSFWDEALARFKIVAENPQRKHDK